MIGNSERMERIRVHADALLKLIREERAERPRTTDGKDGGRELSEAITCIQTGCMYLNESCFVGDREYSPFLKK